MKFATWTPKHPEEDDKNKKDNTTTGDNMQEKNKADKKADMKKDEPSDNLTNLFGNGPF